MSNSKGSTLIGLLLLSMLLTPVESVAAKRSCSTIFTADLNSAPYPLRDSSLSEITKATKSLDPSLSDATHDLSVNLIKLRHLGYSDKVAARIISELPDVSDALLGAEEPSTGYNGFLPTYRQGEPIPGGEVREFIQHPNTLPPRTPIVLYRSIIVSNGDHLLPDHALSGRFHVTYFGDNLETALDYARGDLKGNQSLKAIILRAEVPAYLTLTMKQNYKVIRPEDLPSFAPLVSDIAVFDKESATGNDIKWTERDQFLKDPISQKDRLLIRLKDFFKRKVVVDVVKKVAIWRELSRRKFDSDKAILLLSEDADLRDLYSASNSVDEGESVAQHTKHVHRLFEQQYPLFVKTYDIGNLRKIRLLQTLRFAVLLHDIGKSTAIKAGDKSKQHLYTLPILREQLLKFGFNLEEIQLAEVLVNNDVLGDLAKGTISTDAAKKLMIDLSNRAGLNYYQFYPLQLLFFTADAGSYPFLRGKLFKVNKSGRLEFDRSSYDLDSQFWQSKNNAGPLSKVYIH